VNTTARLAAAAGAGELILSTTAAEAAGRDTTGAKHRTLDLRGRQEPIEVIAIGP
jgi:adenylate cyclase